MSTARVNITDRAKRYRAQNAVTGPRKCVLCGSRSDLGVMHLDGNESHGETANAGERLGRMALYFGCWSDLGHYLHYVGSRHLYDDKPPDLPWDDGLMDTGLLKNGKVLDVPDGRVFWTAGGAKAFWYAFYWWDRSVDTRGASNSGFYVRGFGWPDARAAFDYACAQFPHVVERQKYPLVLQEHKG
jgi:hypothetical protein